MAFSLPAASLPIGVDFDMKMDVVVDEALPRKRKSLPEELFLKE